MKRACTAVLLLIALCASCTTMRRLGEIVCDAESRVSAGIMQVGGFFGGPGQVVAGAMAIALGTVCDLFATGVSAPADLAEDVGLMGGESAPAATSQPSDPGQ